MTILTTRTVAKPWGRSTLPAPFVNPSQEPVGEIWFEPPPYFDALLVKYIFTSEHLSVQCHPSDQQTVAQGLDRQGKEECWLVLDTEPGARLGIGFDVPVDPETLRHAALDGSIERLLTWHSVVSGDFFYIPANTVHAIGAGIILIEVQQNSDITYRLYDYGRPRELHLDEGLAVALGNVHDERLRKRLPAEGSATLVDGPLFRLDRLDGPPDQSVLSRYDTGPALVIPLDCVVTVMGQGVGAGQCALAERLEAALFPKAGRSLIAQPI